jgi:xylan 1,4-beta-xylosidase
MTKKTDMNKLINHLLPLAILAGCCLLSYNTCQGKKPVKPQYAYIDEIDYADPTIFVDNGKYYMSGTCYDEGFGLLESTDLKTWTTPNGKKDYMILEKGKSTFGDYFFWAPQFFKDKGTYYFVYAANERLAIAQAKKITGPYKQLKVGKVDSSEIPNIDGFIFKDNDGKYYIYHARRYEGGKKAGNAIFVAEMDMKTLKMKEGTLKLCVSVTEPWEDTPNNSFANDNVNEGPTVIKRDGVYYMFFSANDYQCIDYSIGYATATSPYGPWTKYKGDPIIHRSIVGENGSGHGDFFIGTDGKPYYVYHVHASSTEVHPRKTRIVPLIMTKNAATGIYDISIDKDKIIKPRIKYRVN